MYLEPGQSGAEVRAQVAIVGSGPAGLALALALGKADRDVLVVEAGLKTASAPAAALAAAADAPGNHAKLEDLGSRRLGGASWTWGGRCVAYDPIDFEPRPGAEAPGWPLSYREMMRTAPQAAEFLSIGLPEFTPPSSAELGPEFPICVLERWSAAPRLLKRHRQMLRDSRSIRVLLGTACTEIAINDQGRVRELVCKAADGTAVTVRPDIVVLAAGGIENARLLLWAFDRLPAHAKPTWLGRGYMGHLAGSIADVVVTPEAAAALDYYRTDEGCFARRRLVIDPATARAEGLLNIGFHIDNPPLRDPAHGSAGLSATALALSTPGLRRTLLSKPERHVLIGPSLDRKETLGHLANVCRAPLSAVAFGTKAVLGRFGTPVRPGVVAKSRKGRYAPKFVAEQSACFESHVALAGQTDALGLPRVKITPHFAAYDVESVLKAHDLLDSSLRMRGLGQVLYRGPPEERAEDVISQSGDGYHQIGLTRMSDAPEWGVTDRDARVHGTENLFIAGSAPFPTSSHANPTFFIVCQALRLASHLIAKSNGRQG